MEQEYLIDSNCMIDFANQKFTASAKLFFVGGYRCKSNYSVITKIEVLGFTTLNEVINEMINSSTVIYLTDDIVDETIKIRKTARIKLPDAIIAAAAVVGNLTLLTRNVEDFAGLDGIKILKPWSL